MELFQKSVSKVREATIIVQDELSPQTSFDVEISCA